MGEKQVTRRAGDVVLRFPRPAHSLSRARRHCPPSRAPYYRENSCRARRRANLGNRALLVIRLRTPAGPGGFSWYRSPRGTPSRSLRDETVVTSNPRTDLPCRGTGTGTTVPIRGRLARERGGIQNANRGAAVSNCSRNTEGSSTILNQSENRARSSMRISWRGWVVSTGPDNQRSTSWTASV